MCGISGLVGSSDRFYARDCVRKMNAALARRGPDSEGMESWDVATLGHRRLSIFDLSDAGRQPMVSEDGRVGLVFNGAIYNFWELRSELEARGCVFHSRTDTEVLLHGYREWGLDAMVPRLRGMFTIGLWDDCERKLFLVRDRLGIKPLCYAVQNGALAFASTPRALRNAGFVSEIDPSAMAEYLEYGYVTDDRSIYQGIVKVPAATILTWDDGRISTRDYWVPPTSTDFRGSFDDAVEETHRLFLQAVERRLQADVPVGALLSGGIDSSLVCWAIRELGGDITAYTAATPGDPLDESEDAQLTATELGLRHRMLDLSREEFPQAEELVAAYAEPFACSSGLGMLRLSKAVKSSATVLLVGDGGDDVFLGYPEYGVFLKAERIAQMVPNSLARVWPNLRNLLPEMGSLGRARHFLDYVTGGLGSMVRVKPGFPSLQRQGISGERLEGARVSRRLIPESAESARHLLEEFLEYDRRGRFVGEYMVKVDGATMCYALEARAPFLDADLCEFARSLPYDLRLRNGQLKAVLRELARREIGERVAQGRKRGFGIPAERWMLNQWRANVDEVFEHSRLAEEGWIRAEGLSQAWQRAKNSGSVSLQLWYLYVLELWFRAEMDYRKNSRSSADMARPSSGRF
jgi:asparagine synthase (glutamine-hydrolysing)